jgi:hypothetical protein
MTEWQKDKKEDMHKLCLIIVKCSRNKNNYGYNGIKGKGAF